MGCHEKRGRVELVSSFGFSVLLRPVALTSLNKLILIRLLVVTMLHKVTLHHRTQIAVRASAWAVTVRTAVLAFLGHVHCAFHFGVSRSLSRIIC